MKLFVFVFSILYLIKELAGFLFVLLSKDEEVRTNYEFPARRWVYVGLSLSYIITLLFLGIN